MKTRTLLLTICTLWTVATWAGPVTQQQAQQTAFNFVQKQFANCKTLRRAATQQYTEQVATSNAYYAFNIGNNEGFVLVSGDDRTVPILGYSDKGRFDISSMPENMRSFLAEYEEAIRNIQDNDIPSQQTTPTRRAKEYVDVAPIVRDSFNQRSPYWNDCPILEYGGRKNHAPTGCVATAIAQIMATFRHPASTKAEIPSYEFTFDNKTYTVPSIKADSIIDWKNIQHKYAEEFNETPADSAIAALMSICGAAVQMRYGVNELGGSTTTANKAAEALVKYFDYEERTVRLIFRHDYSYDRWRDMMYDELVAGRPIIYSGLSADNGHTFICDGYKAEDEKFHINWGWGGQSEGWFSLLLLNPYSLGVGGGTDKSGYGMAQTAIIGIQPNDGTDTPAVDVLSVNYMYPEGFKTEFQRAGSNDDFTGLNVIYDVWNWSGHTHAFDIGLRIIDNAGNTIQNIADEHAQGHLIINNGHWTNQPAEREAVPVTISSSLPDGEYQIIATCRVTGTDSICTAANADARYIAFRISGNQLKVTEMYKEQKVGLRLFEDIEITPLVEGEKMVGKLHQVKAVLVNDGTVFRDDIYYTLNETNPESSQKNTIYATYEELIEGESRTYRFNFRPNQQGDNTIRLYAKDEWGNLYFIGQQTVTVTGAPEIKLYVMDVYNYDTELGAIVGDTLRITAKLTNEGTVAFNGQYDVFLSYSNDQGLNWVDIDYAYPSFFTALTIWPVSLGPGMSAEQQFTWKKLDLNRYHRVLFARGGDSYYHESDMLRTEDYRFEKPEPNGISTIAADTEVPTTVYTLQGIKVLDSKRQMPAGIYIKNGKKIAVK